MSEWLAHPQELGRIPAKMECVGDFELHEMKYYLFKYKKNALGKWLLGVCGGYEGEELEHCGHVYSEMEEYREDTALEKGKAMVEMMRSYWMEQGQKAEEQKEKAGSFASFVLLSENSWDKKQLIHDLETEWSLKADDDKPTDREADTYNDKDSLIFSVGDMMVVVSMMPCPVPQHEAEQNAANNYMWPEAVEAAKAHKAHLVVAVMGRDTNLQERGKVFVKVTACCCMQKNATGIYTSGTVFEPRFYADFAKVMKEGELPIYNWIWFQLYRRESGVCGYTYGMELFGKDEMEVLDADALPSEVQEFLFNLAAYVLESDVTLMDGETIGFSEEDKHPISKSEGVSLPGMTLKIRY